MVEPWLEEDRDYVIAALGSEGPDRLRADAARWAEVCAVSGRRLIRNLLYQLQA
jgi:hypothetical protein